jgi:hypothetical protein
VCSLSYATRFDGKPVVNSETGHGTYHRTPLRRGRELRHLMEQRKLTECSFTSCRRAGSHGLTLGTLSEANRKEDGIQAVRRQLGMTESARIRSRDRLRCPSNAQFGVIRRPRLLRDSQDGRYGTPADIRCGLCMHVCGGGEVGRAYSKHHSTRVSTGQSRKRSKG